MSARKKLNKFVLRRILRRLTIELEIFISKCKCKINMKFGYEVDLKEENKKKLTI